MQTRQTEATNPLYEKLYDRFSYSGQTVGEMMRARAKASGALSHKKKAVFELTAESYITRANSLPHDTVSETPYAPHAYTAAKRRINPFSLLSLFLFLFVFCYLAVTLVQKIPQSSPDHFAIQASEVQLYEPTKDTHHAF